jgi:uncharacterized protein YbjT (DUF2867 family)
MSGSNKLNVVTGAFGYSGKYITRMLLERGDRVRTLTNHPGEAATFSQPIEVMPLNFADSSELARRLDGADTLFNTYWIRFPYGGVDFDRAVVNLETLIEAARRAGVRRIVQVSITGVSTELPLPYFHGKGVIEGVLAQSGISHAILRPALIYGREDILINNIAWALRKFPVFGIPGSGEYRVQPVLVEDLARLAVEASDRSDNYTIDAVGPETYTFNGLVAMLKSAVGSKAIELHIPPAAMWLAADLIGKVTGDVMLTRDEVKGLMADLLVSHAPPTASGRLSEWVHQHAVDLGQHYASEIARRRQPKQSG